MLHASKKKKMKNLLKKDWEKKYSNYVSKLPFEDKELQKAFLECIKKQTPNERKEKWEEIRIRLSNLKEAAKFANPYYIGFGNPTSDILFIGKEKAFNVCESPNLFFKESIDNLYQWKNINNQKKPIDNHSFFQDFGFNPLFPRMLGYGKVGKRKTWGMYAQIISKLYNLNLDSILNEDENSFYKFCFSTEINFIPSKYSDNLQIIDKRETLLQSDFYRNFSKVIIGAKSVISREKISKIFNLDNNWNEVELGEIGKKRKRIQKAYKWKNESRTIIICDQLSGSAGWSKETLNKLVDNIKD